MLTRGDGGGFGGGDWPGIPAPPERDGATMVKGVPVSGVAVPRGSGPPRKLVPEGGSAT
jgi:hypothetical protein